MAADPASPTAKTYPDLPLKVNSIAPSPENSAGRLRGLDGLFHLHGMVA
jgi:hypothetical protein